MDQISNKEETPAIMIWLMFIYSFIALTPMLRNNRLLIYLSFAIILLWAFYFYSNYKHFLAKKKTLFGFLRIACLITVISLLYWVIGLSTAKIGTCTRYFGFFVSVLMGWYASYVASEKHKKIIFYGLVIVLMANILNNLRTISGLSGIEVAEVIESHEDLSANFGGTTFTGVVFLFNVISLLSFLNTIGWYRVVSLICLIVSAYYTIFCGMRGTTIMLFAVAIILLIYHKFKSWGGILGKFISFSLLFLVLLAIVDRNVLFSFLIDISPSERIAQRVSDVAAISEVGLGEDSFTGRGGLFKIAFNSWLDNPISFLFGIGEREYGSTEATKYLAAGISGHSDFIDLLPKFGIIGFSLFIYAFVLIFRLFKQMFKQYSFFSQIQDFFLLFVAYGVFKTIFWTEMSVAAFILFPLACYYIQKHSGTHRSE